MTLMDELEDDLPLSRPFLSVLSSLALWLFLSSFSHAHTTHCHTTPHTHSPHTHAHTVTPHTQLQHLPYTHTHIAHTHTLTWPATLSGTVLPSALEWHEGTGEMDPVTEYGHRMLCH